MRKAFLLLLVPLLVAGFAAMAADKDQVVDPHHPRELGSEIPMAPRFECTDCHDCPHPTEEDPCMAPCPRHANNFTSNQQADDGPDVVIIDQLAEHYEPVIFAHGLHARMSEMTGGCVNCHHYSEQTGEIPACRQCHDQDRNQVDLRQPALKGAYHRQCMNCHMDWSHENACGFCHKSHDENTPVATPDTTDIVGILHPLIEATDSYFYETGAKEGDIVSFHHEDHVKMFGLECVDCHRGDSCGRCHDQQRKTAKRLDHLVTCCQCHQEKGCDFCHSAERMPTFDHEVTADFPLQPFHAKVQCATCHGRPQDFRHPDPQCTVCHIHWEEGDFDHSVTGVVFNGDHEDLDCADCHWDMDFSVKPSCDNCHDDERKYDPNTGFGD